MLSKKYYRVFAELLGKSENLEEFENKLIVYLQNENPRFDKERFREYIRKTLVDRAYLRC